MWFNECCDPASEEAHPEKYHFSKLHFKTEGFPMSFTGGSIYLLKGIIIIKKLMKNVKTLHRLKEPHPNHILLTKTLVRNTKLIQNQKINQKRKEGIYPNTTLKKQTHTQKNKTLKRESSLIFNSNNGNSNNSKSIR